MDERPGVASEPRKSKSVEISEKCFERGLRELLTALRGPTNQMAASVAKEIVVRGSCITVGNVNKKESTKISSYLFDDEKKYAFDHIRSFQH
jgi:hypothetical protein